MLYSITFNDFGHRRELTFPVKLVDSPPHENTNDKNASSRSGAEWRNFTECNRDDYAERPCAHQIRSYENVSKPILIGRACIEPSVEPRSALPSGFFYVSTNDKNGNDK